MPAMLYMPMPPPGTPGSPMFEGANVTEFLERYEDLCSDYHVSAADRLARLPRYCIQPIAETIKSLKEWKDKDYAALKKVLLAEYKNDDTHQLLYSVPFLESYKNIPRTQKDDILDYCRKFNRIAQHCIDKRVLTEYTAGVWFIHGLPPTTSSKLIRKFSIDTEDPSTVNYQEQLEHVMKQTASDKAIQRMNATRAPSQQQSEVVDQIVGQLQPTVSVTKEQRLAEPVVKSKTAESPNTATTAVDQLTKAFEKLSVNLLRQVQTQQQQPYPQISNSYGRYPQQPYRNPSAETQQGQGTGLGSLPSASVGAYGVNQGTGRGQGVCWYCYNQNPQYQNPPHRFREQCPWYLKHLAIGTAHINENGRLARGFPRPNAPEFFIQWNRPEGTQVVMATAGTPEDENVESRPKTQRNEETVPPAGIGSITLLQGVDSEDEEELEEPETFQASAARIERPQKADKWKNPTKILKRPEPSKEKKLAVPKAMRSGEWKPAIVTEDMEVDDEDLEEEAVLVRVENNPNKPKRPPRIPKKKYLDIIKENTNPEAVFDEVMKQPVTIKLQDLLACSPTFAKLLFKGVTIPKEEISMPSAKVGSIGLRHREEKTYAAKTPKLSVKVDGTSTKAMLDTGAEVNVITRSAAEELGLPVRTDLLLALKAVSGDTRAFDGACEDVEIDIGGVINYQTLLVLNNSEHTLILGSPFFHDAQVTFEYDEDGYQYAKILSEDREKVATVRVCVPQGKANRESEDSDLEGNE
jgi:hypothetical protein